jgi:hypothetical protein
MAGTDLTGSLKAQVIKLQDLMGYLEERHEFGAREYEYCQSRLRDVLEHLKRLERMTGPDRFSH